MRRVLIVGVAVFLLCGLGVGGYWVWEGRIVIIPPPGNWTVARLNRLPEAQLIFTGSAIVGRTQREGWRSTDGKFYARVGYTLGTQASVADVEHLGARGWSIDPHVIVATSDRGALGWRKGEMTFRLAVLRQGDPRSPVVLDQCAIPYTIDLFPDPLPTP